MPIRDASAEWTGSLKEGKGTISTETRVLEDAPYGFKSRFEDGPGTNPEEAAALLRQVEGRDYNPPRRDRILAWQAQQEFPILPNPDDPDCGNVYRNLKFPQSVYEHIQEYQEEKIHAEEHAAEAADSR